MFDLRLIRSDPEGFDRALARRGKEPAAEQILKIDTEHRAALNQLQTLQATRNDLARQFAIAKQKGEDTQAIVAESEGLKVRMATAEQESNTLYQQLQELLSELPNILLAEVPEGATDKDNQEVDSWGKLPTFTFQPKRHYELGEALGFMNFEVAAKVSGARFVVLYGPLARLERALAQFMLDIHTREFGYVEVSPPLLVKEKTVFGVGHLPKFRDDQFKTTEGLWLISTSEAVLTNLVSEEILSEDRLPLRYTAHTPCFRQEAGAAGKDTRGMVRQHQFSKVELVSITTPEQSASEHERMLKAAQTILQRLDIAYRVMLLCAGDTGFAAEKTYDIEVWLPGENTYREISSCSKCGDFQARRMNARYRMKPTSGEGKSQPQYVHTLNGSGLAVGRTLIAVLENYQQQDGSIAIPQALVPYMDGLTSISKTSK